MLRFGLRIVEAREARGLTQEELAEAMGLGTRHIQRIEAGGANIRLEMIIELGAALKVKPGSLFRAASPGTARRPGRPSRK
jgi:transcriptional regulator with XRE-family HTH domain